MTNSSNIFKIVYQGTIIVLLSIVIFMIFKNLKNQRESLKETKLLKKSIIASDKLTMEANGRYAKLVDYYNSQRDLLNDLKKTNADLYKTIKSQDERLLSITRAVITLDEKVVKGFGKPDPLDTNKLNFSLRYPDEKEPFIYWDGSIHKQTAAYQGVFSFGKLPLSIVLTEESRGLWKTRLIGPEWLKVDSLSIKSLPPEEYPTVVSKKLQLLFGGSYVYQLNQNSHGLGINVGLNLFDQHNLILGANTFNQVNATYLYKIKSFKKN
jgi:hypothetical protein